MKSSVSFIIVVIISAIICALLAIALNYFYDIEAYPYMITGVIVAAIIAYASTKKGGKNA